MNLTDFNIDYVNTTSPVPTHLSNYPNISIECFHWCKEQSISHLTESILTIPVIIAILMFISYILMKHDIN